MALSGNHRKPGTSAQPLVVTLALVINTVPGCDKTMNPNITLHSRDVTMVSSGNAGHQFSMAFAISMASGQQQGLRQQPKPLTSSWLSATTGVTDISTDPRCGSAMDTDMAIGGSLGLGITMTPGGCTGSSCPPVPYHHLCLWHTNCKATFALPPLYHRLHLPPPSSPSHICWSS